MSELESFDKEKADFFNRFETLRPDIIYAENWTSQQKDYAARHLSKGRAKIGMLSLIPIICQGPDCMYEQMLPSLHTIKPSPPKPCPFESAAVNDFFWDYVEELDVDVTRMVEVSMVRDLVDQEIQQLRKTIILSQEHFIQENVAGVDSEGNVVTKKELHQAVDYEDKILKRKEKLRSALLATRESKAKIGQGQTDGATVIANILEEVRKVDAARQKSLMRELGLAEQDDYIDADLVDDEDTPSPKEE